MKRILSLLSPALSSLYGIGIALTLAFIAPQLGSHGGALHTEILIGIAVFIIFLVQGLQLPTEQMRRGFAAWPVHLFCQVWIFIVFPLIAWGLIQLPEIPLDEAGKIGILYLSILPTTIATNAAFSSRAGGNTAAALISIVLSNLIGALLCPTILAYLLTQKGNMSIRVTPLLLTLTWQLLLPFAIGQILRFKIHPWVEKRKRLLKNTGTVLIFFMVYVAVCNLLGNEKHLPLTNSNLGAIGLTLLLLGIEKFFCWKVIRFQRWPHEFKVAAFYAASQKTLALGLPIATAVYAASSNPSALPPMAIILIPLLVFHIGQLLLGALLIPFLSAMDQTIETRIIE